MYFSLCLFSEELRASSSCPFVPSSTLKSYRADENQYLGILRRASTVKDVLAVSEKLADVRELIEKTEAEFCSLSQQVPMAVFTVTLRSETEAQAFGLHWRPLYQIKVAFRDGMESLAEYGVAMLAVLMRLPAIALWAATLLLAFKYGWALVRRHWRDLIPPAQAAQVQK